MPNFLKPEYLFQERGSLEFWKDLVTFWKEKLYFKNFLQKRNEKKM